MIVGGTMTTSEMTVESLIKYLQALEKQNKGMTLSEVGDIFYRGKVIYKLIKDQTNDD